ncbi:phage terminase large subunit [Hyphomonas sp.]|uniref:phage terminase large subunit n=1 Tax=Alphaproteobacteria TaxID=28211 RepID=UPI0032647A78
MADFKAILRTDLTAFVSKSFTTVNPGQSFLPNWHLAAMAHAVEEVASGVMRRAIFNQPPRSLKSVSISVAAVAWMLGHDPSRRFAVISYSNELASELHRQFRLVIDADWYRDLFPNVRINKDTGMELVTSAGGGRYATSVGGTLTGRGADFVIIDDPQKEDEANSEVARKRVIEWFTGTLLSRLNDKARTPIVVIQQRLHEDDLSGFLLHAGGWFHLKLAAIAPERQTFDIGGGQVYVREKGEPLHATRENLATLTELKQAKGSLLFSAHYQQEPVPLEGNIIKRDWFRSYKRAPEREAGVQCVQSWDIATTIGDARDHSVCLTFLRIRDQYYLVDVWRGRLEYPDLRRKVIALADWCGANVVLIERAGPGLQLLQDLWSELPRGMPRPIGIRPEGSKADRMVTQSAQVEAGQVHLPVEAEWKADFLNELLAFPHGRHDDQVDAFSQFLNWAKTHRSRTVSIFGPILIHA